MSQVERLQRKFAMIHSTLAQQQGAAKGDPDTPKLRQSADGTATMQQQLPAGAPPVNASQANPLVSKRADWRKDSGAAGMFHG